MSEPSPPRSALATVAVPGRYGRPGEAPVRLSERRLALVELSLPASETAAVAAAFSQTFGLELPEPGRWNAAGTLAAVWIRPDTWYLSQPRGASSELAERLASVAGPRAAIVDQSSGKTLIRIAGPAARDILAKGCRVDLHPRVFGPGRAAATPMAQINVLIAQVDDKPTYDLVVPSTFAQSFFEWLAVSAAEFGYEVAPPS